MFYQKEKKIVTIGGGTGSFAVLSELRKRKELGTRISISSIVAMSDSGGSSGILMDQYGVLPAGDIRQSLVALSPTSRFLRKLFLHRYTKGFLEGHSFGNIFISTIEKISDSFPKAIKEAEEILHTLGRTYPVTLDKHELIAENKDGTKIVSEKNFDQSDLRNIKEIYFDSQVSLNPELIKVLSEADIILVNPGSFFTSIIPNFLVNNFVAELKKTSAKKIFATNMVTEKNQTDGFSILTFIKKMEEYVGFSDFDVVLYNNNRILGGKETVRRYREEGKYFVDIDDNLEYGKIKFVGTDFLKKPNKDSINKNFIRYDTKKLIDIILKL
jgi:uncharacterized cofD-like protein